MIGAVGYNQEMLFDTLCRLVERNREGIEPHLKGFPLIRYLQQARCFELEKTAEIVKAAIDWKNVQEYQDTFFLPFPIVSVEDPVSCVVLADTEDQQMGLKSMRKFIFCGAAKSQSAKDKMIEWGWSEEEMRDASQNYAYVGAGEVDKMTFNTEQPGWLYRINCSSFFAFDHDNLEMVIPPAMMPVEMVQEVGRQFVSAIEEILYANQPSNFVVETSLVKTKPPHPKHIPRTHERPKYTLIDPEKARSVLRLPPKTTHGSPDPHPRRRHLRTLRNEVFTHKRGQRVVVSATWVGPSENIVGNRKYKVLLDI